MRKLLEFRMGRCYVDRVTRRLRDPVARHGAPGPSVRAALTLLALVILVMPALELAWNEPKAAERQGTRCPLHANPAVVVCPLAVDAGQDSEPGEVSGAPLRPQVCNASICISPKL